MWQREVALEQDQGRIDGISQVDIVWYGPFDLRLASQMLTMLRTRVSGLPSKRVRNALQLFRKTTRGTNRTTK